MSLAKAEMTPWEEGNRGERCDGLGRNGPQLIVLPFSPSLRA